MGTRIDQVEIPANIQRRCTRCDDRDAPAGVSGYCAKCQLVAEDWARRNPKRPAHMGMEFAQTSPISPIHREGFGGIAVREGNLEQVERDYHGNSFQRLAYGSNE